MEFSLIKLVIDQNPSNFCYYHYSSYEIKKRNERKNERENIKQKKLNDLQWSCPCGAVDSMCSFGQNEAGSSPQDGVVFYLFSGARSVF